MNVIVILLLVIALSEITRLFLTHKPVVKKEHFKQKLVGVEKMIWDLEFKTYKTKEIREDVRKEYDNTKSRLFVIEEEIKNWSKEKDEGDRKRLEDKVVLLKRDIERFEKQLVSFDLEISGSKPTQEYPDGVQGINHQIDSLQELKVMLKDWIKGL